MKLDITVIILTYNEELHLERCIKLINPLVKEIFVVDSFSTDKTIEIANSLNAKVFQHKWINYAEQLNWALESLPINTRWVLRLDADEYLLPELMDEIKQKLPGLSENISGIIFNRRTIFMGKWVNMGYIL